MSKIENKITANDRTISQVLSQKKYTVDYFQREYSWGKKHIEQLVEDLANAFLDCYRPTHSREETENYNSYYLGPFVLSEKDGKRSIIDGQQRLTSLTLFLIYLHHRLTDAEDKANLSAMIYSSSRGKKSFNITVEERAECLRALFEEGDYEVKPNDNESTKNMAKRYLDIAHAFPDAIDSEILPLFVDWLSENVVLVEIVAYSDDNAYTIFETMNDRGLNLSQSEMLKGFVLSRFQSEQEREKANTQWKQAIQSLHEWEADEDLRFFQAWFRGQYAESIRGSQKDSTNQDFEKIGTRFHGWFRENLSQMELTATSSSDFVEFMKKDFTFFLNAYLRIKAAEYDTHPQLEHVGYIDCWGIAKTLSYPLMLAPLTVTDSEELANEKINLVARFIETFCVKRSVNFKNFGASSIRYTMNTLTKEIRHQPLPELHRILASKIEEMDQTWDGIKAFRLHGMNRKFVKFLLSRISGFVDQEAGEGSNFDTYFWATNSIPYEVEHIWADKFERHADEFEQLHEFQETRNSLGDLVLLPRGTNQSYNALPYQEKQPHYIKENLLVKSLCANAYEKNPNFVKMKNRLELPFRAHESFKKADIEERQSLYQEICERIWSFELSNTGNT